MHSRKNLFRCFFGLLFGLACVGCHALTQRPVSVAPLGPRRVYDPTPRPPLQIADPPPPMPAAPPANPVEASPLAEPATLMPAQPAPLPAPSPPAATTITTPPEAPPEPMPAPQSQPTLPTPPQTDTTSPPPVVEPVNPLHRLYQQAAATYATIPGYRARLRQREQVNGKDHPEELMLFQFRKQPWSVYYQWIGPEGHGREVVYVKGAFDGKIHSRLAAGDIPLMPAGMRFSVAPDSSMARGRSRHPIGEAGIGVLIDHFGQVVAAGAKGDARFGSLTYRGPQQRPEFPTPLEMVEQVIPPGLETPLPRGGSRKWGFAPDSHLPVFISTRDEKGQEVEYYCYEQLEYPVQLTDDDFNPDRLWARRSH